MSIQSASLNLNNNYKNTQAKNVSFRGVVSHNFPPNPTKETLTLFSSPDFHKLTQALSDEGKDLHVCYHPKNLRLDGPCGCTPIPEMYGLYCCDKGITDEFVHLENVVADEGKYYQNIDVSKLMKKVVDKYIPIQDVNVKNIVEYITDGINANLNNNK